MGVCCLLLNLHRKPQMKGSFVPETYFSNLSVVRHSIMACTLTYSSIFTLYTVSDSFCSTSCIFISSNSIVFIDVEGGGEEYGGLIVESQCM